MGTIAANANQVLTGSPTIIEVRGKWKARDSDKGKPVSIYATNADGSPIDLQTDLTKLNDIRAEANLMLIAYNNMTTCVWYDTEIVLRGINSVDDIDASGTRSEKTNIRCTILSNDPDKKKSYVTLNVLAPNDTVLEGGGDDARELNIASANLQAFINYIRDDNPNTTVFRWSTTQNGHEPNVSPSFQAQFNPNSGTVKFGNTSR